MSSFKLSTLPTDLQWQNEPLDWKLAQNDLTITAGALSDWFIDPANGKATGNAPTALFTPPDKNFVFSAKVTVDFASMFDAGVLKIHARDDLWAKLCFEYSPQSKPMVVSVVTRGVSDDCNSAVIEDNSVYLRLAREGQTFSFHYSRHAEFWYLVRYFSLGELPSLQIGLSSQSPTGQKCTATFSEISYREGKIKDIRGGE
jgi:regulation of enolase protein 1 (concanavalin A-like superfamily)